MNNKKSITIIMVGYLNQTPPALTLIQSLSTHYDNVRVIAAGDNRKESFPGFHFDNVFFENIIGNYDTRVSLLSKMIRLFKIRKTIWKKLNEAERKDDLLIAISEVTIKHLGEKLTKREYIYYQLELIKDICYVPHVNLWKINVKKIANCAKDVIVCEYNRAHITKVWWQMKKLPKVIMNKPYVPFMDCDNVPENVIEKVKEVEKRANGRAIVLYQGVISKQRPIEPFIDAVSLAKSKYCFVLLSDKKTEKEYDSDVLIHIPFIQPPYHMEITKLASIGVLAYGPSATSSYSELNPIYCAPNKVWEYTRFGIPMISNDLPGLKMEFLLHSIGICVDEMGPHKILREYENIMSNFSDYQRNASNYYNSYNVEDAIISIVESHN